MKATRFFVLSVFAFSMLLASGTEVKAADGAWSGNMNLFLGQKTLDSGDWEPLDKQGEVGLTFDVKKDDWPVSLAVDILASRDEDTVLGVDVEGSTTEVDFGVRKVWDTKTVRPFVGGGLAIVSAEIEAEFLGVFGSDRDSALGFWANAGG